MITKSIPLQERIIVALDGKNNRGVSFATIHGNDAIIRAAVEVRGDMKLLAVTVLTSFGEEDMRAMGMTQSVADLVLFRARRALELGCDGAVSSGMETGRLRKDLGGRLLIVTPGIRPGANVPDPADDQKRIVTAGMAIGSGADHVVVGRPITRAEDPIKMIEAMQQDISSTLSI